MMFYVGLLLFFLGGTVVGSFLSVIVHRLHNDEKGIFAGRSKCPVCQHKLSWKNLIPLFSYLIQKGKCEYCGKKISFYYPLLEILVGIFFVLIAVYANSTVEIIYLLFIFSVFAGLIVSDWRYQEIDLRLLIPGFVMVVLKNTFLGVPSFGSAILGAFVFFIFFGAQLLLGRYLKKSLVGDGDLILGVMLGFLLGGEKSILALFLTYVFGSTVAVYLLIRKKVKMGNRIALGPFLIISGVIAYFWGGEILNAYFWYRGVL